MKLFEVIFWGSRGDPDGEDTLYLVRAPDFRTAIDVVTACAPVSDRLEPKPNMVHELGTDLGHESDPTPCVLRGPYFAHAYNRGWKAWCRNEADWEALEE